MRKLASTLAIDFQQNTPVISLRFKKDFGLIKRQSDYESSKIMEIYTQDSKKELRRIINPLDDFG